MLLLIYIISSRFGLLVARPSLNGRSPFSFLKFKGGRLNHRLAHEEAERYSWNPGGSLERFCRRIDYIVISQGFRVCPTLSFHYFCSTPSRTALRFKLFLLGLRNVDTVRQQKEFDSVVFGSIVCVLFKLPPDLPRFMSIFSSSGYHVIVVLLALLSLAAGMLCWVFPALNVRRVKLGFIGTIGCWLTDVTRVSVASLPQFGIPYLTLAFHCGVRLCITASHSVCPLLFYPTSPVDYCPSPAQSPQMCRSDFSTAFLLV
ncbi:hypothetical protein EV421DRAFT_1510647 [Armillaria borealis]|uniref:Uncharacterized protein n=1 Tax=Armillaria borealis TaxID=47425 RepID=A0AA39IZT7_9AGAR|nr:hypothetical protein EV421DRAFT_1510647 [Armillaria borealis]